MLKRCMKYSFICLLACLLMAAVLIPFAVDDLLSFAKTKDEEYSRRTELLSVSAEDIATLRIEQAYIQHLQVKKSSDDNIHIYTDGYRISDAGITHYTDEEGVMRLYITTSGMSTLSVLERSNFLKGFAAWLNNRMNNTIEIYLPENIAFDPENLYGWWEIESGLEVVRHEQPEEDEEQWSEEFEHAGLSPEEVLATAAELREADDWLITYYRERLDAGDYISEILTTEAYENLKNTTSLLVRGYTGEAQLSELEVRIYLLAQRRVYTNIVELERSRAQRAYSAGELPKQSFYDLDIMLDEQLQDFLQHTDEMWEGEHDETLDAIHQLERVFNIDLVFDEHLTTDEINLLKPMQ